jgi:polysaccharide biosynthesis/export protein
MTYLILFLTLLQAVTPRATLSEYVVGPKDKLAIVVFDEPALTRSITVDGDGTFDYPLLGRVRAGGLSVRAIQEDMTARLKKDFLVNPQVAIEVETYRSQSVYVTGQVRLPGAVPLMGNMTVMEALARAGSPTPDAGSYIVINRRPPGEGSGQTVQERIAMSDLQNGRVQTISLRDGDTIYVPKAETFFVTGQVRNPGPYLIDGDLTIARALSMAGGVTERGSRSRLRITRVVDGRQITIKNPKPDDLVWPGDSIEVLTRLF